MKKVKLLPFLSLLLFFVSCKKDSSNNDTQENLANAYYYEATIGGINYKEVITQNNTNQNLGLGSGFSLNGDDATFHSEIINEQAGRTTISIGKGILYNYPTATLESFKNFFKPASYPYAQYPNNNNGGLLSNGISIDWKDKTGKEWSSIFGTANQTGSTFKILSADGFLGNGQSFLYDKVTIEFTCKLYDGNGNSLPASGKYVGQFGND